MGKQVLGTQLEVSTHQGGWDRACGGQLMLCRAETADTLPFSFSRDISLGTSSQPGAATSAEVNLS